MLSELAGTRAERHGESVPRADDLGTCIAVTRVTGIPLTPVTLGRDLRRLSRAW